MVKQYAAIAFICAVAVLALAGFARTTRIDGKVMAKNLLESLHEQDPSIEEVECDGEIPIERKGARFVCTLYSSYDSFDVEYEMARDGSLRTLPVVSRKRRP